MQYPSLRERQVSIICQKAHNLCHKQFEDLPSPLHVGMETELLQRHLRNIKRRESDINLY